MAKRFIDTEFYKSPFVRSLKGPLKALYSYIICDCNGAGIWVKDLEVASLYTGFKFTAKDWEVNFVDTGKAIDLQNGRFFFPDFIEHQYSNGLSATNPAHKNFISELLKYGLLDESLKVLPSPLKGTKSPSLRYLGNSNGNSNGKSKGNNKEQREKEFRKSAGAFSDQYGQEMIDEFCNYWTESNPKGKKLLFETKRTFDIKRRLSTWSKNNFNGNNANKLNNRKQGKGYKSPSEIARDELRKKIAADGN